MGTVDRVVARHSASLGIFVPHASDVLTDHLANGDGLVAFEVVARLARRGHVVHVASPQIDVRQPLPPTLNLHELDVPGATSALGRLRYMIEVRRLFERVRRETRIDVVHQLNPVFTGISLALIGSGVPIVLGSYLADWPREFAGVRSVGWRGAVARTAKRRIASLQQRQADAIFLTTPAAQSRIVNMRRDGRKIAILPHGIDPAPYALPQALRNGGEPPSILFVGGIEERKGIFVLLDAFRRVRERVPECRLIVAGWGRKGEQFRETITRQRDEVELLYNVERAKIPELLHGSTVLCMPSFGEPFGMALLEAMAAGKPVVVTDAGGAGHIADDRGARKVPPGDPNRLADALVDILVSPDLQAEMGRHNRSRVEELYGWDRVIESLERKYRALCAPSRTHRS